MAHNVVPVTLGSPTFTTVDVGPLRVTEARFPPLLTLEPHVHERPIVAVILDGSWDEVFPGRSVECPPSTLLTEPAGERHGNRFHQAGARVLIVEPDPAERDLWQPCARLLSRADCRPDAVVAALARRAAAELTVPDGAARLALEGLAFELLALAARRRDAAGHAGPMPPWLRRVQEILHARFREPLAVQAIARAVGTHPAHLARAFRARFRISVGGYVRQLRLEWAAGQLARGEEPLSHIAAGAGFADQSHFTRAFKRYSGTTPGAYRRARAS